MSYPVRTLSDRIGKGRLLSLGYLLFGLMSMGFIILPLNMVTLVVLFILAGAYISLVDALEGASGRPFRRMRGLATPLPFRCSQAWPWSYS